MDINFEKQDDHDRPFQFRLKEMQNLLLRNKLMGDSLY